MRISESVRTIVQRVSAAAGRATSPVMISRIGMSRATVPGASLSHVRFAGGYGNRPAIQVSVGTGGDCRVSQLSGVTFVPVPPEIRERGVLRRVDADPLSRSPRARRRPAGVAPRKAIHERSASGFWIQSELIVEVVHELRGRLFRPAVDVAGV